MFKYYLERFDEEKGILKDLVLMFKAYAMFDVRLGGLVNLDMARLDTLAKIDSFKNLVPGMKAELAQYKALVTEHGQQVDDIILSFFSQFREIVPSWNEAARIVALFQPSRAAAERVFSCLERMFGDQQHLVLEDVLETGVMLSFNR